MESGPKQGLKCNFKIVGALRIPGPPVTIRGPLSVLQRPLYFYSAVMLTKFRFTYYVPVDIKLSFRPWNVRSDRKKAL